jgi:hypothetical protein
MLGPLLFGALALALGQDANWDLRNYHWYNAYAFLNHREGFDLLPSQTPYFYNPALDIPFYLLATHLPAIVAGFILGSVQGLNFILLFMLAYAALQIANTRHKVWVCAALAALGMIGGGGIALLGTTFYDNVTSLGTFLSALLVVRYFSSLLILATPQAFGLAVLFGIPAGLTMGLKLPSVVFCVGLCASLLLVGGGMRRRFMLGFAFGVGVLIGLAVTLGYWGWFLQSHYGNPLFPYFNQLFKSPLAPLTSARDTQYVPRSVHDFILFPWIFLQSPYRTGEIHWRDWRIPMLYALLPLSLILQMIFGRNANRADAAVTPLVRRYLLWVAVLSYFIWLPLFAIYRYLVVLEMLTPLLIVMTVDMLPFKLKTRGILAVFLLLVVAASIQPGNWYRRASWSEHYVTASIPELGDTSQLMILMAGFEPYSHLVSAFPNNIPFVRIQSNFASPNEDKGINDLIHARVDGHQGRFMLLIPPWQRGLAAEALGFFRLVIAPGTCQQVTDHLYDDKSMELCSVIRIKG